MSKFRVCWWCIIFSFLFSGCNQRYSERNQLVKHEFVFGDQSQNNKASLELPRISNDEIVVYHFAYSVSYNSTSLNPNWVAYELTREEANGDATSRNGRNFVLDPDFGGKQANYFDFNNSGWDKGHLAPAADMKWSEKAMEECFFFTNCSPQNHDFNNGMWNSLENNVRSWARKYGRVYVITGPVFTTNQYGTLGTDKVAVPDSFFKACLAPKGDSYIAIGFLMDNNNLSGNLGSFACTVDELESVIGLDLFYELDDQIENEIEAVVKWGDWGFAKPKVTTE